MESLSITENENILTIESRVPSHVNEDNIEDYFDFEYYTVEDDGFDSITNNLSVSFYFRTEEGLKSNKGDVVSFFKEQVSKM